MQLAEMIRFSDGEPLPEALSDSAINALREAVRKRRRLSGWVRVSPLAVIR